ncbi:MAG: redoxin domain-containing protein [Planctomycetaceae bacterium]
MRHGLKKLFVILCCLATGSMAAAAEPNGFAFQLPAGEQRVAELTMLDAEQVTVVCFLGTECPLAKLYGPRLQELATEFAGKGVEFVGINSNRQDSMEEVLQYAQGHGITFPIGKDYDHAVASRFGATRTPEVFVVKGGRQILYQGRIDDRYLPGLTKPEANREELKAALTQIVTGQSVAVAKTEPVGCLLGRVTETPQPTRLTYCQEISRILQRQCVECHKAGEIGPFALTDYDEVVGWGEMIVEVIGDGRMPPWHASETQGHFVNARRMPEAEKLAVREWVAGGMPYGEVADLPPAVEAAEEWQLGREPDLVLDMRAEPFEVPAEGTVEYQYFVVDPGFEEDKWVAGAQILPGNRSVVHHGIIFIRPPGDERPQGVGWLTAYVPGQRLTHFPANMARRVPAGSKLVFQMHYTPTGVAASDLSKLGITFADPAEVDEEVFTVMAQRQDFEIPPHAADHVVSGGTTKFPRNGRLLAIAPHMHVRGKAVEVYVRDQDRRPQLLDVPRYDFNWQHVYVLAEPQPLDDIERLEFEIHFDNSKANPANPDPTKPVHWGDQTWEEMAIVFFEVARPRGDDSASERDAANEPRKNRKVTETDVRTFFERFDPDGDGVVHEEDVPLATRRFAFGRFDRNGDGQLTRQEVEQTSRN